MPPPPTSREASPAPPSSPNTEDGNNVSTGGGTAPDSASGPDDILNTSDFQIQFVGTFDQDKQEGGVHPSISSKELKKVLEILRAKESSAKDPKNKDAEDKDSENKQAKVPDSIANITLEILRNRTSLSSKYLFALEGGNPVKDDMTLTDYIASTPGNVKILETISESLTAPAGSGIDGAPQAAGGPSKLKRSPVLTLYFTHKRRRPPAAELDKKLAWAQENAKPTGFKDNSANIGTYGPLSSLYNQALVKPGDYAAKSGGTLSQPAELTAAAWQLVMKQNTLLHGVFFDKNGTIERARYPAFKLKGPKDIKKNVAKKAGGAPEDGTPEDDGSEKEDDEFEEIPIFEVCDDSKVTVDEAADETKKNFLIYGFDSKTVEVAVSGGYGGFTAAAYGSYSGETHNTTGGQEGHMNKHLIATYSFPRVKVFLDETTLELTQGCKKRLEDIMKTRSAEKLREFYMDYGVMFPTIIELGGKLTSTREYKSDSQVDMTDEKRKMKAAAGASMSYGTFASGSVKGSWETANDEKHEKTTGETTDNLTWEAKGGDTTLVSNPPEWCSTVKNHLNWRSLNYSRTLAIADVIAKVQQKEYGDIFSVFRRIEFPALVVSTGTRSDEKNTDVALTEGGPGRGALLLYYQDNLGLIWEAESGTLTAGDNGAWTTAGSWSKRPLFGARKLSPLAVTNNVTKDSSGKVTDTKVRLYYCDVDDTLKDVSWDVDPKTNNKRWQPGNLSKLNIKVPPGRKIAATSWGGGDASEIRFFYQNEHREICVILFTEGKWYAEPSPLTNALDDKEGPTWLIAANYEYGWSHRSVPYVFYRNEGKTFLLHEDNINANRWYCEQKQKPGWKDFPAHERLVVVGNDNTADPEGYWRSLAFDKYPTSNDSVLLISSRLSRPYYCYSIEAGKKKAINAVAGACVHDGKDNPSFFAFSWDIEGFGFGISVVDWNGKNSAFVGNPMGERLGSKQRAHAEWDWKWP